MRKVAAMRVQVSFLVLSCTIIILSACTSLTAGVLSTPPVEVTPEVTLEQVNPVVGEIPSTDSDTFGSLPIRGRDLGVEENVEGSQATVKALGEQGYVPITNTRGDLSIVYRGGSQTYCFLPQPQLIELDGSAGSIVQTGRGNGFTYYGPDSEADSSVKLLAFVRIPQDPPWLRCALARTKEGHQTIAGTHLRLILIDGLNQVIGTLNPLYAATSNVHYEQVATGMELSADGQDVEFRTRRWPHLDWALNDAIHAGGRSIPLADARALTEGSSNGTETTVVFGDALYTRELGNQPVPLVAFSEDGVITNLFAIGPEEEGSEYLVRRLFTGYMIDSEHERIVRVGHVLRELRTGAYQVWLDGEWGEIGLPEKFTDLLNVGQSMWDSYEDIVDPDPTATKVVRNTPPLEQPSNLRVDIDEWTLDRLVHIDSSDRAVALDGRSLEVIELMGASSIPGLSEQYQAFFDTEWVITPFNPGRYEIDIRWLGAQLSDDGRVSFQEVGIFYGFVQSDSRYMVLQIEPGSDLNPLDDREAFIASDIGNLSSRWCSQGIGPYLGLRTIGEYGNLIQKFVFRRGRPSAKIACWDVEELQRHFDLRRGTIITTFAMAADQRYVPWMFFLQVDKIPTPEEQRAGGFSIKATGGW